MPRRQDISSTTDQSDAEHQDVSITTSPKQKRPKSSVRTSNHEPDNDTSSQQRFLNGRKAAGVQKKDLAEAKRLDDGDDQSTQSKTRENRRTRTTTKTSLESEAREDEERDSETVSDNDSVRMFQPEKNPNRDTNSAAIKRRRKPGTKPSNGHSTIDQIVSSAKQLQPVPSDEEYASIPAKSERSAGKVTTSSTPSNSRTNQASDLYYLRTKSYRQAQQASPPAVFRRSEIILSTTDHVGTPPNRRSEPTPAHDTIWMGISNRSYSPLTLVQTIPDVEHEQKRHDDLISAAASSPAAPAEHSASEGEAVEEPNEEDGRYNERDRLLLKPQRIVEGREPITSRANNAMTPLTRSRRARFRWHFLYTIIHNYHLLDLRKNIQSRLAFLHMQRSQMVYDQQTPLVVTDPQSPLVAEGRSVIVTVFCCCQIVQREITSYSAKRQYIHFEPFSFSKNDVANTRGGIFSAFSTLAIRHYSWRDYRCLSSESSGAIHRHSSANVLRRYSTISITYGSFPFTTSIYCSTCDGLIIE